MPWTFYPAFLGTAISIIAWTYFARREHITHIPRTLSELAAERPDALRYYRVVLWICGPLIAVTAFGFILIRIDHPVIVGIALAVMVITEMLVGVFPAQRGRLTLHDIIAAAMGGSMIILAYLFALSLDGVYVYLELGFALCMTILAILCLSDRKRYLFYELSLIYLSHFSILTAALALS